MQLRNRARNLGLVDDAQATIKCEERLGWLKRQPGQNKGSKKSLDGSQSTYAPIQFENPASSGEASPISNLYEIHETSSNTEKWEVPSAKQAS